MADSVPKAFSPLNISTPTVVFQEKVEEPTFEEMLRKAIAAVLNEYSDRSRRSVQNFTDQHVHITDMTWGTDNATVSLAVNSTKAGMHVFV